MKKINSIGIIGLGMVGGNLHKWFQENSDITTYGYDTNSERTNNTWEETSRADLFFVCVPSPYREGEGVDLSILEQVAEKIAQVGEEKIICVKSTVPPGTTSGLQRKYPMHKWVFIPEFLREVSAYEDTANPDLVVIGLTKESQPEKEVFLSIMPGKEHLVCTSDEAEIIKYGRNVFLTQKVVFANVLFDIATKLGGDYENVKKGVTHDPRIGESHFSVNHYGGRGAGGTCFPKDLATFAQYLKSEGYDTFHIFDEIKKYNDHLLDTTEKDKGRQFFDTVKKS